MDQVRRYRPPPNPVKEKDSRTASYRARFKTSTCWELDALSPDVLAGLIRTEIVGLIDQRAWKRAEQNEAKARKRLAALAEDWA